jgi:hypothetical protein
VGIVLKFSFTRKTPTPASSRGGTDDDAGGVAGVREQFAATTAMRSQRGEESNVRPHLPRGV